MDVSPKTVREVEFREKLRGYHPEDVDQFLERVAKGIEILQERLRAATDRVASAERIAAESTEGDDALRRTLVLAQRTADAAIQEAREQAAALLSDGQAQASAIIREAEARAASMVDEAERALRSDVAQLATVREELLKDVASITSWIDDHRSHLTSALNDAVERLRNDLQPLRGAPAASVVDIPPPPVAPVPVEEASPAVAEMVDEQNGPEADHMPPIPEAAAAEASPMPPPPAGGASEQMWDPQGRRSKHNEAAEAAQFFAELRQAVDDPRPLGPREVDQVASPEPTHRDPTFFDDDDDLTGGRRFGSRLRRRR
jgi:cell division initiation protein